jgi:fructose-bisphosphate aldolase class II
MKTLRDYINDAAKSKTALGHFNFATAEMLRGIVEAAKEAGRPVIVGLSEGERDFFGVGQARAMVDAYREQFDIPIFLNADHTKSFERAKEAIDAGFDAVVADGSALSFSENAEMVRKIISYAKKIGKDVIVEGELGFIGTSSEVLEELPPGVPIDESKMTLPEEAAKFVKETGVTLLAPAVGNVHGVVGDGGNPPLSIKRIKEIRSAAGIPLVLHGASGVSENDVREAVKAGAAIVHFSTDLRVAFRKALMTALSDNPDEVSPYKYLREGIKAVKETVAGKLDLLS